MLKFSIPEVFGMIILFSCNFYLEDEASLTRAVQSMCSKVIFEVKKSTYFSLGEMKNKTYIKVN